MSKYTFSESRNAVDGVIENTTRWLFVPISDQKPHSTAIKLYNVQHGYLTARCTYINIGHACALKNR